MYLVVWGVNDLKEIGKSVRATKKSQDAGCGIMFGK